MEYLFIALKLINGGGKVFKVGQYIKMKVARKLDFGYYLDAKTGNMDDDIFLPIKSPDKELNIGDEIEVFIYKDSEDRIIATAKKPLAKAGDIAYLEVVAKTKFGAFADFGLERDIFVPFKEQAYNLEVGNRYLFYVYVDNTNRLAATTYIEDYLETTEDYKTGDHVEAVAYEMQESDNVLVAIDNKYKGIVLKKEYYNNIEMGEKLELRVKKYYEDGRISLTPRENGKTERNELEKDIVEYLKEHDGFMRYNDKSKPEDIERVFHSSKRYFKESLGGLMKKDVIYQDEEGTRLKHR